MAAAEPTETTDPDRDQPGAAPAALAALAPAAALAVFGLWAGTVAGGATAAGAAAGHLLLLVAALVGAASWRDPLELGRAGRLLPWALWLLTAASAWASPVPRAGRVAVALLPAFLLLPAAVARAWRGSAGRRWGAPGISAVVAASALWALGGRFLGGDPRAAAPLGHHLLLAVWLLALLPVAVLPAARERGWRRWLGAAAAAAGAAALAATGSLAGWAGLALEAGLAAWVLGRRVGGTRAGGERDRHRAGEERRHPPQVPAGGGEGGGADRAGDGRCHRVPPGCGGRPVDGLPSRSGPAPRRGLGVAAAVLAVVAIAVLAAVAAPRLQRIATGADPSASARAVYARAALAGAMERPALGWGPGAAAWTAAEHVRPVPGVNPPGEVVAELHSLPLQVAYELGWSGLLLAVTLAGLFARRRATASAPPASADGALPRQADPGLTAAGLIGLAGAAVALLATGWLAVTALPAALAIAAGAALAGAPRSRLGAETAGALRAGCHAFAPSGLRVAGAPPGPRARGLRCTWPVLLYAVAAAAVLAPLDLAQLAYDRAVAAGSPEDARVQLDRAVRLDPSFPLYRAWRAWEREGIAPPAAVAAEARAAAEGARGLAGLWLAAGVYGADAGAPWAAAALDRACDLDPLGALAPFHRMAIAPATLAAPAAGGRALLAAPQLAAATFWESHPALLEAALAEALAWEGIDPGWREALIAEVRGLGPAAGETARLALRVDPGGAESLLLRAFRRRSRSFLLAPVEVRREAAERLALPPAAELPTSRPAAFAGPGCGAPAASPGAPGGR